MLQKMRDNLKGTVAVVIIILLLIPFTFVGIDMFTPATGVQQAVAEVNGETITEIQIQNEIYRRRNQMREQFGDSLPADFLSDENLRGPALAGLIERELLRQTALDGNMTVPESQIAAAVRDAPQFQQDGRYSEELYVQFLRASGMTHAQFIAANIEDRVLNQLVSGLVASEFATDKDVGKIAELSQQTRDFYFLTIPLAPLLETVEVTDEAAREFYDANKEEYVNPEQVTIEYIELSLEAIRSDIEIPEEELRAEYEEEVAAFDARPERHAAHILIEPREDGSEQAIIAEVQGKLEAGEEFAALAEQYSDDLGSKATGGDLGFTRGDTFPEPFEAALAELEVGAVSGPVQTESGTHFIKLLEERGAQPPSFEEERPRLERALQMAEARDIYIDLARQLEDLSYNAESLAPVGEELNVPVRTAGPFSRDGGAGIAANPQVVEIAFSTDVLADGNTSNIIDLGDDRQVVLRVTEHQQARTLTFDEVETEVRRELTRQRAQAQVAELGEKLATEVRAGRSVEEVAKEHGYEWQVKQDAQRTDPQVPRDVLEFVFGMAKPKADQPVVAGTTKNNGDYVLVSLTEVEPGSFASMAEAEKSNLEQRLARMDGESTYAAFQATLEQRADIERPDEDQP